MFKKEFYKFKNIYFIFLSLVSIFLLHFFYQILKATDEIGEVGLNLSFLLDKDFSFYYIQELNLFFCLSIGIASFLQERINGRLRLSLHFPNSNFINISYIIFGGLIMIFVTFLSEILALNLVLFNFYPGEILKVINFHLLLNMLFGVCIYLFCGAIIIENLKKIAIFNLAILLISVYFYFKINPDIYKFSSFYQNEDGFFYCLFCLIYAILAIFLAFKDYKMGYIR
ncbi:MAG: hypothetical protein MR902_05015 [Campylobacter sp.]|nr:hypothetical protein [Campylobacter sp.]